MNAGIVSIEQMGATNNLACVTIGDLDLYFSYKTLIAYADFQDGKVVSRNYWSATTGKHLNNIDGGNKGGRLDSETFEAKVAEMLKRHNLSEETA